MTTDEAVRRLFHPRVVEHVRREAQKNAPKPSKVPKHKGKAT
jgi:hypothetical protein